MLKKWQYFIPWLVALLFGLYKIQDLSLPYFWDEAWSYFPALEAMQETGPSLLPNAIDPQLYRGHPLLFYFLQSTWMNFLPNNIDWAKTFPLIISILLLVCTYKFSAEVFNKKVGNLSIVLLAVQPVFLAQSSLLLPEILLSLFTILALNAFIKNLRLQVIFWVTCALYTKESALVLGLSLIIWQLVQVYLNKKNTSLWIGLLKSTYLLIPFGLITIFFVLQKLWVGWVFFPEHLGYINLSESLEKANNYIGYLLIFQGRNLLTFAGIAGLFILVYKKDKQLKNKQNELLGLSFFILSYLAFSSLNFYSPRYLLSILPITIVMFSFLIVKAFSHKNWIFTPLVLVLIINNGYHSFFRFEPNDHTLGYRDMIKVHQKIISTLEKEVETESEIATHFLMKYNLENPSLGYLTNKKPFTNVASEVSNHTQFVIVSNIESSNILQDFLANSPKQLISRAEQGKCWSELYQINLSDSLK